MRIANIRLTKKLQKYTQVRISGGLFRISEPVVLERVEILSLIEQFQFNFLDDSRWQFIVSGLKNTIIITFFAVLLGVFSGISDCHCPFHT